MGDIKQVSTVIVNILISYLITLIWVRMCLHVTLPFHSLPAWNLCCQLKGENQQQLHVFGLLYKEILEDLGPTLFPPTVSFLRNFQSGSSCCSFLLLNTWKNGRSSAESEAACHIELSHQSILTLPKYSVLILFWDHITFCIWHTFIGKCIITDLWAAWYHTKFKRTYLPEKKHLYKPLD
jgi:hypothetical protein